MTLRGYRRYSAIHSRGRNRVSDPATGNPSRRRQPGERCDSWVHIPHRTVSGDSVQLRTATTDSSGVARVTATANQQPGSYTVSADLQGLSASFLLTNTVGQPAILSDVSGTPQPALHGATFAVPLKVKLTDSAGNPWSGVTVTFTAPSTGADGHVPQLSRAQPMPSGVASMTPTVREHCRRLYRHG